MQKLGYLIINGEKVLVLARAKWNSTNYKWAFRHRKSGDNGEFFKHESEYFSSGGGYWGNAPEQLIAGDTIYA